MGIERCNICECMADSKVDAGSYDNPDEVFVCYGCIEKGLPINGWLPIETAPKDRDIALAAYIVPSDTAYINGSRSHWTFAHGRDLGFTYTGILGGNPSHWKEIQS